MRARGYKGTYYKELVHYGGWAIPKSAVRKLEAKRATATVPVQKPISWRPKQSQCFNSSPKLDKDCCPSSRQSGRSSFLREGQPFCSVQAFHQSSGRASCLQIQVLISSRYTLTDAPKMFNQISTHPVVKLTHKVNHHKCTPCQIGTNIHTTSP